MAPSLTLVLTNWKRPDNLRQIIDQLSTQTARPVLWLWNNNPPFHHETIEWQIDSSKNRACLPRWYMASFAETEFVAVMDDDLTWTDERVLEDAMHAVRLSPEGTAAGFTGVRLQPGSTYRDGEHVHASAQSDERVDIVKGRFLMTRTADLARIHLRPSPEWNDLIGDDILVSGALAQGKPSAHLVLSVLAGRWRELPNHDALYGQPDHWETRERARRAAFAF